MTCDLRIGMLPLLLALLGVAVLQAQPPVPSRRFAGLTVPEWHDRLKDVDPKSPSASALVPPLAELIADDSLRGVDREPFAVYLARMGAPARPVVPLLATFVANRDPSTSDYLWASRALALLGEPAKEATPVLIDLLFDESIPAGYRQSPVEALARIGPAHPDAIPALLRLLQYRASTRTSPGDAATMRRLAAEAIFLIGPDAEIAAPLLIRMVRSPTESEAVRRSAIVALGALKSRGGIAVTVLAEELARGGSPALRDAAAQSLVSVGPDAVPVLSQFLEHQDWQVRWRVSYYLRESSSRQTTLPLRPQLFALLKDDRPLVNIAATESCWQLYGSSPELVENAIELLAAKDRQVRIRAKRLLLTSGPLEEAQLNHLHELLDRSAPHATASIRATLRQLTRIKQAAGH